MGLRRKINISMLTSIFPRYLGDHRGSFIGYLANGLSMEKSICLRVIAPSGKKSLKYEKWVDLSIHRFNYWFSQNGQAITYNKGAFPDKDNIINVISVDLNPDPPIVNENLEVLIKLNSTISITEASGVLDIKAFGIDITKVNFNPCEQKDVCPLNKNTVKTISITELIPKEAPAGIKINTETTLNSDNKKLVCIDLQTILSKKTLLLDDNQPNSDYCGNIMGNPLEINANQKTHIANVTATIYGMKYHCDEKYVYLNNGYLILPKDPNDCMNKVLTEFGASFTLNVVYEQTTDSLKIIDTPIGDIQLKNCNYSYII